MLLNKKVELYKSLFSKSFFFDKFILTNIFQYPKISYLKIKFFISSQLNLSKLKYCKIILLFYLLTGQKPKVLIKNYKIRAIKRKKVTGLLLTLHQYDYFLDFLIKRQFALIPFFKPFLIRNISTFNFDISQSIHDDDLLFQVLQFTDVINYKLCLKTVSSVKSHLESFLINFKIPCKLL